MQGGQAYSKFKAPIETGLQTNCAMDFTEEIIVQSGKMSNCLPIAYCLSHIIMSPSIWNYCQAMENARKYFNKYICSILIAFRICLQVLTPGDVVLNGRNNHVWRGLGGVMHTFLMEDPGMSCFMEPFPRAWRTRLCLTGSSQVSYLLCETSESTLSFFLPKY